MRRLRGKISPGAAQEPPPLVFMASLGFNGDVIKSGLLSFSAKRKRSWNERQAATLWFAVAT